MALEKCSYCSERVNKGKLKLHLKSCPGYRRNLRKRGFTKFVFPEDIEVINEPEQAPGENLVGLEENPETTTSGESGEVISETSDNAGQEIAEEEAAEEVKPEPEQAPGEKKTTKRRRS